MNEKIKEFDSKIKELGINPNDFFVITFREHGETYLQGNYSDELCKQLSDITTGELIAHGYIDFNTKDFKFTLC